MQLIRTLHIRKFDKDKKRFQSDCFSVYGNGISVFDAECAFQTTSEGLCKHIEQFYPTTVGTPIVFWKINTEDILQTDGFETMQLIQSDSFSGDRCHYDIVIDNKNKTKNFVRTHCKPPHIFLCSENCEAIELEEDYENLMVSMPE